MKEYELDAVVIGGGAAGMAAALTIDDNLFSVALIEREEALGGILLQCIHNGFGLHEFGEELTGPEYAERFSVKVEQSSIKVFKDTTVLHLVNEPEHKEIHCYSSKHGVFIIRTKALVLSMGCRERNRGNIGTAGTRPSGIFTAGLAQRLINIDGYVPGKDVVIVGSGDIGLIMARRMSWIGCKVHAVIEIQPYPSGLTRNIVQCLNDFDIPLYLSHAVTNIKGKDRIEEIEVAPIKEGKYEYSEGFKIKCDTLLLSVGLVPENELSKECGVKISSIYNGPDVGYNMMTNIEGVFACGNVLHVHDLVDFVTKESRITGNYVVGYLKDKKAKSQFKVQAGANIRYVMPQKFIFNENNHFYMRSLVVKNNAVLKGNINGTTVFEKKMSHVQPSEMISYNLTKEKLDMFKDIDAPVLEISLQ